MECNLGTVLAQEKKNITVQVTADGKNFAGMASSNETLENTAVATCSTNSTDATPAPMCSSQSKVATLVSVHCTAMARHVTH
jgi:hypothetical protein